MYNIHMWQLDNIVSPKIFSFELEKIENLRFSGAFWNQSLILCFEKRHKYSDIIVIEDQIYLVLWLAVIKIWTSFCLKNYKITESKPQNVEDYQPPSWTNYLDISTHLRKAGSKSPFLNWWPTHPKSRYQKYFIPLRNLWVSLRYCFNLTPT